jgi:hypothetical protein
MTKSHLREPPVEIPGGNSIRQFFVVGGQDTEMSHAFYSQTCRLK